MLCVVSAGSLFAQKGFNVSVALQPGISMLSGDWKVYQDPTTSYLFKKSVTFGFAGGAIGGFNFTDNMGVSAGLIFSSQGQKYADLTVQPNAYGSETINQTIHLSYFKIPLKFNYSTDPTKSVSFLGSAGFYLGFLTGYKQTVEENGSYTAYGTTYNISATSVTTGTTVTYTGSQSSSTHNLDSKPFKSADFGLTLSVGAQKKLMEKLFLFVMINFEKGFGDVKNVSTQETLSNGTLTPYYNANDPNRSVTHSNTLLGLMIGVKKAF